MIRYLLAYLGLPWEDRFYDLGRAPEFGTQAWTGEAATPAERQQRVRQSVGQCGLDGFWCWLWDD